MITHNIDFNEELIVIIFQLLVSVLLVLLSKPLSLITISSGLKGVSCELRQLVYLLQQECFFCDNFES